MRSMTQFRRMPIVCRIRYDRLLTRSMRKTNQCHRTIDHLIVKFCFEPFAVSCGYRSKKSYYTLKAYSESLGCLPAHKFSSSPAREASAVSGFPVRIRVQAPPPIHLSHVNDVKGRPSRVSLELAPIIHLFLPSSKTQSIFILRSSPNVWEKTTERCIFHPTSGLAPIPSLAYGSNGTTMSARYFAAFSPSIARNDDRCINFKAQLRFSK